MTAAEIDEGAVDRLLTVLGEHGRIERDLARKAIIAALPAPASGGASKVTTDTPLGGQSDIGINQTSEIRRLKGTIGYCLAQAEAGYPTVLSVIKANLRAALDDDWQATVAAALPAPASGEIDEGAVEKAYRAYMDFVTDATTNDRGWTFRQAVRAMLLAALPAPASRQRLMRAEVQRLRSLLEYRDEFIVSQGLWQTFVDGLPRALPVTEPGSNP
jgi:hypothetical protein